MKLRKILSATFAAILLTSSICLASVSTETVSESTMKTKCTDQARCSIYVKNGSSYTEYRSSLSGKAAAQEIAGALGSDSVEAYTSNKILFNCLKDIGDVSNLGSMRIPGIDVYHFIFAQRYN